MRRLKGLTTVTALVCVNKGGSFIAAETCNDDLVSDENGADTVAGLLNADVGHSTCSRINRAKAIQEPAPPARP
jgi:hypothetical protein